MLTGSLRIKGKAQTRSSVSLEDADRELLRVLNEVASDINLACPRYREMTQVIRKFAASRFASRTQIVVGVTGAMPGDGCTTVALNLAAALADIHGNVLYVEAERSGDETLQEQAGYVVSSGLCGYLRNEVSLEESILMTGKKGLSILPAGREIEDVSPLERLNGLRSLFGVLRGSFDVTVVDLPPLLASEDASSLVAGLDGIVVVVSAGSTNLTDVKQSLEACDSVPLEGIVINQVVQKTPGWLASLFTSEGQRGLA